MNTKTQNPDESGTNTITVQMLQSDLSQEEIKTKLEEVLNDLVVQDVIKKAQVETVFPGDAENPYKSLFVVHVEDGVSHVASFLNSLPDVEKAYVAPQRKTLGR